MQRICVLALLATLCWSGGLNGQNNQPVQAKWFFEAELVESGRRDHAGTRLDLDGPGSFVVLICRISST